MSYTTQFARLVPVVAASIIVVLITIQPAFAVDPAVKRACKKDYFSFCSKHAVGTPAVRKCFRVNGHRLSKRCVKALNNAGMVPRSLRRKKTARR